MAKLVDGLAMTVIENERSTILFLALYDFDSSATKRANADA
jgi:hypothetical protein